MMSNPKSFCVIERNKHALINVAHLNKPKDLKFLLSTDPQGRLFKKNIYIITKNKRRKLHIQYAQILI